MIRISQLKLPIDHTRREMEEEICRRLRIAPEELREVTIFRRSTDARKKPELFYVYTVDVRCAREEAVLKKKRRDPSIAHAKLPVYSPPSLVTPNRESPVVVGSGPAGLFCALLLARAGFRPRILERGKRVEERAVDVARFWKTGLLNPQSNVQFGEGGAGTFSDGKLNTGVKDPQGRIRFILETFVRTGADSRILWDSHPHIGTDDLIGVVRNLRKEMEDLGAEFLFDSRLDNVQKNAGSGYTLTLENGETLSAGQVVMAIGHSARDTFAMLHHQGVVMEPKTFAVGIRAAHPQRLIDRTLYGETYAGRLEPSPYRLAAKCSSGSGVYSFCMCPGGYVVNASSEEGRLCVNGMSNRQRDGAYANSAIVVTVSQQQYGAPDCGIFAGILFQRQLERAAYLAAAGKIPVQRYTDFLESRKTTEIPDPLLYARGKAAGANVREILPEWLAKDIIEGMTVFNRQIPGFAGEEALVMGVESRTSSPVRILRDEHLCAPGFPGLYPCGEGAGYAGGITSAAIDGMRIAEEILRNA